MKKLTAFLLAIVLLVSSVQVPGGVSYAAELAGSGIESGQEFLEPSEEETAAAMTTAAIEASQETEADSESGSESTDEEENAVPDSEGQQEDSAVSDEEETQPDESTTTDGDNRTESATEEETTMEDVGETASDAEVKPDKYQYENFEQTYTALDGTTLSSKAAGKPKVLIFYRTDSDTCWETFKSIRDDIGAFCGADIYAIELNSGTKDEVSSFKVQYGCDKILFAYDEAAGVNLGKMSEYTEKAGIPDGTEVKLPIIAYIDANDKFQLLTKDQSSAPDVLANLEEYCDYVFKITYVLNGGENDRDNPNTYTSKSDTIVLKNASKNGCTFKGWYSDAACTQEVKEIAKGNKGDITLYAKWEVNKYNKANPAQSYNTLEGTIIRSTANVKPKVLIFYYDAYLQCQNTIKSIRDDIGVFCNADIYAIECGGDTKENVSKFREQYGCSQIRFAYDYDTTTGPNIKKMSEYTAAIGIPAESDVLLPVICYIDAKNKFQLLTQDESSADDVLSNLEEFCGYNYKITYELNGGTNASDNPKSYTSKTDTIVLKDASKEGCTFEGWYKDAEFTQAVTEIAKGNIGDIKLYAKWKVNPYNLANREQTYTALDGTKLSSTVAGKPKVLIFYINESTNDRCKNTIKSISDNMGDFSGADIYAIECNRSTKDNISIFRNNYGCNNILFAYDETGKINLPGMKAYELAATGENKQTYTYPLICYIDTDDRFRMMTVGESSAKDVLANLKDYCGYVAQEGVYNIRYELNGGMNDSGNMAFYTSETAVILRDPVRDGYIFSGWYKDAAFQEKVTEIAVGSTGDITLYANWKVNRYNLLNPEQTYTALDGTKLSSQADGKPKVLIFYSNNGTYSRRTIKSVSDNINDFSDVDIYAIECKQATKENVSKLQTEYGCEQILFAYDTAGTVNKPGMQPYAEAVTDTNATTYPIICYIDTNNRFQLMTSGESSADDIFTNLMEYCGYVFKEETYKITYELNGGTNNSSNPDTYVSRTETIVLKDAVREGCTFEGWYKDAAFKVKVTEITKADRGDITLYAKWRVPGYKLPNLNQTYTALDGTQLSSTAVGKPKVLIFYYDDRSAEAAATIQSVRDWIGDFDGADLYVIECSGAAKDNVSKFQRMYGCDKTLFAYDETKDVNTLKMSEYTEAAGIPGGTEVLLPIICYIDDDNDFQMMTQGESSAQDILNNLQEYCGYVSPEGLYQITLLEESFVYNGKAQKPGVEVTTVENGKYITLEKGTDYTLSYKNNIDAGIATVVVKGKGQYKGTMEENFVIEPAPLVIRAEDMALLVGDKIPEKYGYEVDGLQESDELIREPSLVSDIISTEQEGEYYVTPYGADAGSNYVITYEDGVLIVVKENVYWKVTFDTQGRGKAPSAYVGVRSGDTIDIPTEPTAEGYRFDGWYQDSECTKSWDFASNIVESDITLYAKWLCVSSDGSFALQEIPDQYYTGKALKPAVSVYDGDTLLKAGKDYQLKYYNNINVNAESKSADFDPALPYVEVIGKGNYKNTVKVNFNILKVSIDNGGRPATGAVLKVNDQMVKSNKPLKPSVSLKIGRALKKDTDFKLDIQPSAAVDSSGHTLNRLTTPEIPAGATGEFFLMINGIGNYEGSIVQMIYVADSSHLIKNAKITLGKKMQTTITWKGKPITLPSTTNVEKDPNAFMVQMEGKNKPVTLKKGTHYKVIPWEGSAGKAELIIEGIYPYVGRQSIPFYVKGFAFSNSTVSVSGITDKTYTGKAWTQNDAVVTYKGASGPRVYGVDYTIKYSKNIDKGTATMTIIGNPKEGYTGSVKKTFKIKAADIADKSQVIRDPSMESITVSYSKVGVKPVDEIILTSKEGIRLRYGKDYTLKYKDNKAVTDNATITVTGKGNYSGSFDVPFKIVAADLSEDRIVVLPTAVPYKENKPADFVYKPAVKLKDGKASMAAGKDYEIEYLKNTQADYENYLEKFKAGTVQDDDVPRVRITAKDGSNYGLPADKAIDVDLQIYQTKFDKKKLSVQIVGDTVYTGGQVTPQITVSYDGKALKEGEDYMLAYGANDKAGKNKGSITITGLAPYYGGSVTVKFDISGKDLKY